VKMLYHIN